MPNRIPKAASSTGSALVTGGSAGLGAEFARQLAARGQDLLLVARREERLKELAHQLGVAHGVRVDFFAADLAEPEAPARIEAFVRAQGLRIDWLSTTRASPDRICSRSATGPPRPASSS
jgi:hypothetical protein